MARAAYICYRAVLRDASNQGVVLSDFEADLPRYLLSARPQQVHLPLVPNAILQIFVVDPDSRYAR